MSGHVYQRNKSKDHVVIALDHLRRAKLKARQELTPESFHQWNILHEPAVNKLKSLLELYPSETPS